jgi:hypothetical protein
MSNIRKLFQYLINICEGESAAVTLYKPMSWSIPFMLPDRYVDEVEDPEAEGSR